MKALNLFLVFLLALSASSVWPAYSAASTGNDESSDGIATKSVAVVSTVGDTFHLAYRGVTIFETKNGSASVPEWEINAHAEKATVEYLRSLARYKASILPGDFDADNLEIVLDSAKKSNFDFLVTISSREQGNPPYLRDPAGLYRQSFLGFWEDCIYSLLIIKVYNVRSGEFYGQKGNRSKFDALICYGTDERGLPWDDAVEWKPDLDDYGADLVELLKQNVIANITETLPPALARYGFAEGQTPEETFADYQENRKAKHFFQ